MERELEPYQRVERSIQKKFRKSIWVPFIAAVKRYELIQENDKIAVCISGGKDSMLMAKLLQELQKYSEVPFELVYLVMDPGYNELNRKKIESNAALLHIPITIFETDIFSLANNTEKNPCYLCAKMRRGALNDMAIENGCNKVALGHHNDDVLETFFLSLMHEGRIHCFSPVTYLDRTDMYQIRPMIYVRERDIRGVVKNYDIPVVHNPCPADGYTQRQYMKDLIKRLEKEMYPGLRKRLFRAIQDSAIDGWSDYTK